ncbi:conserved hypothetical protein [Chloroherpeton thalassium ATCC 35110]|uniref:Uncharacterized protein n=1 Tax=Chloroherpeton thalassium (strain ATCC 35110 / GB-78) TaxID=517418 RepID=B3QVF1_CHLT3|nr:hypothetical protein [Chloroherpeton thalassium]ACF14551.1 conserved hypothetical protein [Chloroherpeton thalassium ATCC 35110]
MPFFILLLILFFVGCTEDNSLKQEFHELKKEKQKANELVQKQQAFVEEVTQDLVEIQRNLNQIHQKQEHLTKTSSDIEKYKREGSKSLKDSIVKQIADIDVFLKKNQERLTDLERTVKNSDIKISHLQSLINELREAIIEREEEIYLLKEEVKHLNIQIAALESTVDVLDEVIEKQEKELTTAYYVIGSEQELLAAGIVEVKGGILGLIGQSVMLSNDFNLSKFNELDIVLNTDFTIDRPAENIRILTSHSKSSYELKPRGPNVTQLVINDIDTFWKKSKYLVVLID